MEVGETGKTVSLSILGCNARLLVSGLGPVRRLSQVYFGYNFMDGFF